MANLSGPTVLFVVFRIALSFASNSDIISFFPLNSTLITGVFKNADSCTYLSSKTIQGSSTAVTVEGPDTNDTALNLASDNWINLGDFKDTCISNPALCSNGMSVTFWIRLNASDSGDRHVINTGKLDTSRGIQVFLANSHTNVVICDGTKRYPAEIDFPSYWTHVAAVYNPSGSTASDKFYVYINGTKKSTARYETSCALGDTDTSLLIGHDDVGSLSGGRELGLYQLAFFSRSLNQTEIQQIYSNPTSGIQLHCPPSTSPPSTSAPITGLNATTNGSGMIPSSSSGINSTTGPSESGSGLGQTEDNDSKRRSPTVLILLSLSLLFLLVIVIIIIIGCCLIVPSAKEKGYKCL